MFGNNNSYCRLCAELRPKSDLVEIQDNVASNLNLEYKILHCFQLQVENDDRLPRCVCSECCDQVIRIFEFNEKVERAQQTLYSILSDLESNIDVKLETYNSDFKDDKESVTNLDKKPIVQPVDLAQCVFKSDSPDLLSERDDDSDDDVPLNERKIQIQKTKSSAKPKKYENIDESGLDEASNRSASDVDELKTNNLDRRLQKFLEDWKNYTWVCINCNNLKLANIKELRDHWTETHNAQAQYKCMECNKVYEKYCLFAHHVRAHRDKHKFRCDNCGKFFYKRAHYERHIETHLDIRKYMCSTCGKSFKTQGGLYAHSHMHLPNELRNKYECDVCHKCLSTAPNLIAHKKIHLENKEYLCEQCGKSFTLKVNLRNHIRSKHSGEKPYSCNVCTKAFKTSHSLKCHKTLHTNVRPYKCEICGKGYREKGTLRIHTKMHSSELPFECEFCKKRFKVKSCLKIHMRQHTGERPYSCQECNLHFANWSNFSKHKKVKHGNNSKSAIESQQEEFSKQDIVQRPNDSN